MPLTNGATTSEFITMGVGGISPWSLLLILAIVLVLFGAKRLRNVGGDLGAALKGFKSAMKDESGKEQINDKGTDTANRQDDVIDVTPSKKETDKT